MRIGNFIRRFLSIRSPTLHIQSYYCCYNCRHHDDCGCVVCEEHDTVVCNRLGRHVSKWFACDKFKPIKKEV
jgi:hypothetical protein